MADDTTTVATATDTGTASPNPSADTSNSDTTTTDAPNSDKTFTQAEVTRIVTRETKEAVKKALEAEAAKAAEAEMSEAQKEKAAREAAETRATEAESRAQVIMVRNAVTLAVSDPKLQARDPKAIALLVNSDSLSVDGEDVDGIDAELKRIRATHPALFYSTTADGGARSSENVPVRPGVDRIKNAYANPPRR